MAGYTRQSLAQILNGEIVSAPPLNAEFNQILAAFNNSTGHKHDGTAAEGPPIDRIADSDQNNLIFVDTSANQINFYVESSAASVGQISIQDGAIVPFTDNDIDLGSSSFEFKDLYIDGTANIDSLVADTADINAGTIDNTVIGATTPAAATFTNLTVSTGSTINFSGATVSNGGTFTTVTISGGTITGITDLAIADGGTGASTASVARTNLGVAIGTNVQAYDAGLQSISGLTTTADQMIYTTSSDTYATTSLTSAGRALLDDASASAQRTTLGLGTLATQDANSVAITGGTISGISNISDPGTSLPYTFSTTTTDSDPGSGIVRLNNATQNAATEIYIDDEDNDGTNVSGVIALLAGGNNPSSVLGYVTIRKEFAPENFITMKITTLTSASGYTKLVGTVEASSGATPFSDTDNLYFSIDVSGDKGDPGDISGPGSSTDNAVVRWDGTSGGLIQDSSVVIDDSGNVTTAGRIHSTTTGFRFPDNTDQTTAGVIGPASSTDNAVVRWDGTSGGLIQDSSVIVDDSGNVGIGTSSPSTLLDVDGTITAAQYDSTESLPDIKPSLNLDFANVKKLDPRITFTRGSTATYYDGKTFAKAEENLFVDSENFRDSGTNFVPLALSLVDDVDITTGPDGISDADALIPSTDANVHRVRYTISQTGTYTVSLFVKPNGYNYIALSSAGDITNSVVFNITSGSEAVQSTNGTASNGAITASGNGYFRISATLVLGSTLGPYILVMSNATTFNFTGDGTSGIYLWGAQLEQRSALTDYTATTTQPITNYIPALQTAASGDARFDHDPITGESKGFLIEEQRTNLLTYSEQFDNAAWTKTRSSITSNIVVAPDGTLTGDKLVEDTSVTLNHRVEDNATVTNSNPVTFTVFAKAGERPRTVIQLVDTGTGANGVTATFNLSSGTVVGTAINGSGAGASAQIFDAGNGWYRCSVTGTTNGSGTGVICRVYIDNGTSSTYTGDGYSGIYIWGAQLEAGSFPTSYIPTVASQVTRSPDAASMTGTNFSSWYRQDEGTVFVQFQTDLSSISKVFWTLSDGVFANSMYLSTDTSNVLGMAPDTSPTFLGINLGAYTGLYTSVAFGFESGSASASKDGAAAVVDSSVFPQPTINRLQIGAAGWGSPSIYLNGHIKKLAYYPKRLSNATLQALTEE
jgi:hypothetical protein